MKFRVTLLVTAMPALLAVTSCEKNPAKSGKNPATDSAQMESSKRSPDEDPMVALYARLVPYQDPGISQLNDVSFDQLLTKVMRPSEGSVAIRESYSQNPSQAFATLLDKVISTAESRAKLQSLFQNDQQKAFAKTIDLHRKEFNALVDHVLPTEPDATKLKYLYQSEPGLAFNRLTDQLIAIGTDAEKLRQDYTDQPIKAFQKLREWRQIHG